MNGGSKQMETLTEEYKKHLESLKPIDLNIFINQIKSFKEDKGQGSYFNKIENYLNEFIPKELLNLIQKGEFTKIFYLEPQAKYIKENLNLKQDLDIIKTMVYCYNDNSREFNKNIEEEKLKKELLGKGFIEQETTDKEELKKLNGLKVICVFDKDKIEILGSFTEKGEYEGKFYFDETQNQLFFMPKRHTRTGQILINKFYYKEI